MKRFTIGVAAIVMTAGAAMADPVVGTWKTQPGDDGNYGLVKISTCGSKICGTLGKGYDSAGKEVANPNNGKKMIWDMNADGGGKYSGGKIWAPDRNKTYNSKMALSGNTLKVSGCVLGVCRSQNWTRVK